MIKEFEKCGVSIDALPTFCGGKHGGTTMKAIIGKWRDEADAEKAAAAGGAAQDPAAAAVPSVAVDEVPDVSKLELS